MVKKLWLSMVYILAACLLVVGGNLLVLRYAHGNEVTMQKSAYEGSGVRIEVYAGPEAPNAHWLFLGASDPDVSMILVAPHGRSLYAGTGRSSVRNDGDFEIRIQRRHLGFIWWPDQTVRFDLPREQLPKLTDATRDALFEDFSARVAAQK
ncbi:MAG: hypothetical protein K0R39_1986 [Symbiobacteriaceae bacterium]|jgi:hypothetical protein|nr:hypothetical protein [Symbiobacteriaceae bacterium]